MYIRGFQMLRISFFIMMMFTSPFFIQAQEVAVDIAYPKNAIVLEAGKGEVALWVEDARANKLLGQTVNGEALVPASDIATSFYAYMASSLKQAGYTVVPYSSEIATGLLVRVQSIHYRSSKEMLSSKVAVTAIIESKRNASNVTKTYQATVEDQFALKPSASDNRTMIGKALATAAQACLSDAENIQPAE